MRFSELQRKEIIAANSGRFLGYVEDAVVQQDTGYVIAFVVAEPKKIMSFSGAKKETLKIPIEDVLVVGKDVILVKGLD
ncbi:PRC-barrel domain-containing protein [Rummeliibacillus sp. JY-2-4R]